MKRKLIDRNKTSFGNIKENKMKIWEEINQTDKFVEVNGVIDSTLAIRKKSLLGDMEVILREEEIHRKQKAKRKWLKEEDNNTKFFYKMACDKKRKRLISRMKIQGVDVMDMDVINQEADCFFSSVYSKEHVDRLVIDNLFSS